MRAFIVATVAIVAACCINVDAQTAAESDIAFDRGAGADEAARAVPLRQETDRFVGPRRVQGHLEHAKAVARQRLADRVDLLGRNAAQHRDERQRIEIGGEGIHGR